MIFPLAVLCVFSLASASDVIELTDSDFTNKIDDYPLALVEFFAPWCGHCKKLAPEYEAAATALKGNDDPIALVKVDCTANTVVCGKYDVSGYPTLKIFRNGKMVEDYNGPREKAGIVKTLKGKAGPSSKELTSVDAAETFLKKPEFACIGFFSDATSALAKTFQSVADAMSADMRFAHSSSAEVAEKYGAKDDIIFFQPAILKSKFEESQYKYTEDATVYKIKQWINDKSLGLCGHRVASNADKFKKPLVVAYFDVDYVKNVKGTNYWRNRVMKVAKGFQEENKEVYFAISSLSEFERELSEFGLETPSGDKPIIAARNAKDQKFLMADEFSMDNLKKFVNDLLDDKLEPFMKSEAVPDNSGNAVKVLVAKNFDEFVTDDKDVLIEFYAPWCGHCKSLEPKYNELAEKLSNEPEIVIAKMDATANDVPPQYEVQGFPTLYFKPKNSAPKKYQGGREVVDFVQYLAKESTNELSGYKRDGKKKRTKKTEL